MIGRLLPSSVEVREVAVDLDVDLPPLERDLVRHAVASRHAEFTTTRACARAALGALGRPGAPIGRGSRGEPLWPDGYVGSLTHCSGYRGAAVARASDLWALGIDAEPHRPLPEGISAMIVTAAERPSLARLARRDPGVHWDTVLFSAKETVYKAWYPLMRRWLGFDEVTLTLDPDAGTFVAELLVAGPVLPDGSVVRAFRGGWQVVDGLVGTATALPVSAVAERPAPAAAVPGAHAIACAADRVGPR